MASGGKSFSTRSTSSASIIHNRKAVADSKPMSSTGVGTSKPRPPETDSLRCMITEKAVNVGGTNNLWKGERFLTWKGSKGDWTLSSTKCDNLKSYQLQGIQWLLKIHHAGIGGAILADDMGLGKTRQIACFLSGLFETKLITWVLIIVPKTLVKSWIDELKLFELSTREYSGPKRHNGLDCIRKEGGVLVATYGVDMEPLAGYTWHYIFYDEGHALRNVTETYKKLNKVKGDHRIIVSGTPLQNRTKELFVLFDFCRNTLLGKDLKHYEENFDKAIIKANGVNATESEKEYGQRRVEILNNRIKPYYLRREKEEVLGDELPQKTVLVVWLSLTKHQRHLYEQVIELHAKRSKKSLPDIKVLENICHDARMLKSQQIDHLNLIPFDTNIENYEGSSCKLRFIKHLLEDLTRQDHSVLIFSYSLDMLGIIQSSINYSNVLRIDGGTKDTKRDELVKKFQDGVKPAIFLISSGVGGAGLTLTRADRVIIVEPSWNPSMESQIADRAYRIGQNKDVIVYRLMTCETIEDNKYKQQAHKESLIRSATGGILHLSHFDHEKLTAGMFKKSESGYSKSKTMKQLDNIHKEDYHIDSAMKRHIDALVDMDHVSGVSLHSLAKKTKKPGFKDKG